MRISSEQFEKERRRSMESLFTGNAPVEGLFRQPEWISVLLPGGLRLEPDSFDALGATARARGDEELVLAGYRDEFEDQPVLVVPWVRDELEQAETGTVLGHIDTVGFGQSQTWAMFASPETFAVLGGEPDFIDEFCRRLGGAEMVKTRFRQAAMRGEIGFGDRGRPYVGQLLTAVGWER